MDTYLYRPGKSAPFAETAQRLADEILPALARRHDLDGKFRREVQRYAVQELCWAFSGSPDDLRRFSRAAALALIAALGCYAALRPKRPGLQTIPPGPTHADIVPGSAAASAAAGLAVDDLLMAVALGGLGAATLAALAESAGEVVPAAAPTDVIGPLWEEIAPRAERRYSGQFYSQPDPIDLILSFCVRSGTTTLLDPACGSGAFLVRALSRLGALCGAGARVRPAEQLRGVDVDSGALRLATYNVAARCGTAPSLHHGDFFALDPHGAPLVGAVVGNPPYTRQEALGDRATGIKEAAGTAVAKDWNLDVSGRAGLHVPFLLHAAAFLAPGGRLGFLTSNSWLNADYGGDLRRFLLDHTRIIAVVVPGGERWFGAGVNAVALIAEREENAALRRGHRARFVRLKRPLSALIGVAAGDGDRWPAVDRLVRRIESADDGVEGCDLTVATVSQEALDDDRAMPSRVWAAGDSSGGRRTGRPDSGAKWAVHLGAPRLYNELLRQAAHRCCQLGELANVRRGLTTGANTFFYVRDVTGGLDDEELARLGMRREQLATLRVVAAGDGSRHVVEARYLRPVVISPREVARLVVDLDRLRYRVVLLPLDRTALTGTRALDYVKWGEQVTRLAERETCRGRASWWSLRPSAAGALFWCKTSFARHIVPLNPGRCLADCNLYHLTPVEGVDGELLAAALNSTPVALVKELHGRANLGEGALKTEIRDLLALPVPDVRQLAGETLLRIWAGFRERPAGKLCDELMAADRRALDEALLEAIGFGEEAQRRAFLEDLYSAVTDLVGARLAAGRALKNAGKPAGAGKLAQARIEALPVHNGAESGS